MKPIHLLTIISVLGFLTGCQQPYSHLTYGTWSPRSLSRLAVDGGKNEVLVPEQVTEVLAIDPKTETLFNGTEQYVWRMTLNGKPLGGFNPPKYMRALALDAKGGHLYLAEQKGSHDIVRTDLDGKNLTVIVRDARYCQALAFDGKRQVLYWSRQATSGGPTSIWRANADGTGAQQVSQEMRVSKAIAVDERGGRLFWSSPGLENNTGRIMCANLDGTNAKALLTNLPLYVEGLAVDSAAHRFYWIERHSGHAKPARIRSARYDGSDVQTLQEFSGINHAMSLALGWLQGERK